MNTINGFNHEYIRDWTSQCQPALQTDPQIEKPQLSADFVQFLKSQAPEADFLCVGKQGGSYSMLREPTRPLRHTLIERLAKTIKTHQQWVRPTSNSINERNRMFALGVLNADTHMEGIKHLRVTKNGFAHIWVATSTPLNAQEALEASMWFRIMNSLAPLNPATHGLKDINLMPVPMMDPQEPQSIEAELIDGPTLAIPGFAQRMEILLAAPASGWRYELLTPNQLDLISTPSEGIHKKLGYAEYAQCFFEGVKHLALGLEPNEAIAAVAQSLIDRFDKFRLDNESAVRLANKYIKSIVNRRPAVEGAYTRKDEAIKQAQTQLKAKKKGLQNFHALPLATRQQMIKNHGIMAIHSMDF